MTPSTWKERACRLLRTFVPAGSDIEHGPPVARVIPFTDGLLALGIVIAYAGGLPPVSSTTLPLFIAPAALLASRKAYVVTAGYVLLAVGCSARAATVWWVPTLQGGQQFTATVVWLYLTYRFALSARMVWARGVRRHG